MQLAVNVNHFTDYQNVLIAPSKGNLYRNVNPDEVQFQFGDAYVKDEFFPGKTAELMEPFVLSISVILFCSADDVGMSRH